jgi:DNA repair protein RecN (Recombination protein N)
VNLEKLKKDTGATYAALYEADGSVLERLKMMASVLAELSSLDISLAGIAGGMRDSTLQLEELAFDLSRYLDKLDLDPAELTEVHERLNIINRILNKYGDPIEATLAYRQEIGDKIHELEKATDDFSSLQSQLSPLLMELKKLGRDLTEKRQAVAKKLGPLVQRQLAELGMEKATFTISVTPMPCVGGAGPGSEDDKKKNEPSATPSGFDQVEFIAQTNPGQLPQPLRKIGSGGELSRIMLALKGILAQSDRISVLVFDEIDANVGGRLGSTIGNKLRHLASHHQVLCITHLPQIASYADRHLAVRKQVADNNTATTVRATTGPERIQELAEMIGGQRITDTTRAQAQELLDSAQAEFSPAPVRPRKNGKPVGKTVKG